MAPGDGEDLEVGAEDLLHARHVYECLHDRRRAIVVAHRWMEENLRLRAELERQTEVVGADDVERTSVRDGERHLETLLGRVAVPRLVYQAPVASIYGRTSPSEMQTRSSMISGSTLGPTCDSNERARHVPRTQVPEQRVRQSEAPEANRFSIVV